MHQSLLLSAEDVLALRAALALPQFAAVSNAVPALTRALAHPQPDFAGWLDNVTDAIREARSNTSYPEDWDDLSDAVSQARAARRNFFEQPESEASGARATAPLYCYVHVVERIGSNDGPSFSKQCYLDYAEACRALKARAESEHDPLIDDDLHLNEYSNAEKGAYGLNLVAESGSVVLQYYLQRFALSFDVSADQKGAA